MTLIKMLNPFTGKKPGDAPDVKYDVQRVVPEYVEEVLQKLDSIRPALKYPLLFTFGQKFLPVMRKLPLPAFTPAQINETIDALLSRPSWNEAVPGAFVSVLVERSYQAGFNDFVLTPRGKLHNLCYGLIARKKNRARVTVVGDTGMYGFSKCRYCDIVVKGDVGSSAAIKMRNGTLHVHGDAADCVGQSSKNTIFTFDGKISEHIFLDAKGCIFQVKDKDAYRYLQYYMSTGLIDKSQNRLEHI